MLEGGELGEAFEVGRASGRKMVTWERCLNLEGCLKEWRRVRRAFGIGRGFCKEQGESGEVFEFGRASERKRVS